MMDNPKGKSESVMESLRGDIVNGVYRPGHRLPAMTEICNEFGIGVSSVQRALSRLADDGFVEMKAKRHGTFVAKHPPHLCNYALVAPVYEQWSRLYMAIRKAAGTVQSETVRFGEYITSSEVGQREGVRRLCDDVCGHRVGGVILAGSFGELAGTPALEQRGVPRVRVHDTPGSDVPVVWMDMHGSFITRAVEYLKSRGRRRIAHLRLVTEINSRRRFDAALANAGIEVRPYWVQPVLGGAIEEETAGNAVGLLMQLEGDKRPDGLIIHDDNLVNHAAAGLMAYGIKVPEELEIVAHYNYPSPVPSVLPMKRLGFDCRMFLRKSVEILEIQRQGGTPPAVTRLPALFEDELEPDTRIFRGPIGGR
jgi:DNA-binding LacI/PurR family transcriptional regulator